LLLLLLLLLLLALQPWGSFAETSLTLQRARHCSIHLLLSSPQS
jgi:hypothetical protein